MVQSPEVRHLAQWAKLASFVSAVIGLLTPNNNNNNNNNNNMVSTDLVAVMPYALYANTRDDLGSQRREGA